MQNTDREVTLTGTIEEGDGKAKDFISLPGYMEQFETKLEYEPYPGTLNIHLDAGSVEVRKQIQSWDPIRIDGWETEEGSFGPVYCVPATITTETGAESYEPVHIIYPERTDHDLSTVELLAPVRLRERIPLSTGDQVVVEAEKP